MGLAAWCTADWLDVHHITQPVLSTESKKTTKPKSVWLAGAVCVSSLISVSTGSTVLLIYKHSMNKQLFVF